jgi:type III secretion system YscD/HrpQ family protein
LSEADRLALVTNFVEKRRVPGEVELNLEPVRTGGFRIAGAVSTQAKLTALTEAAQSELAAAGPVNFAVLLRSQLAERFEAQLREAGLARKFKVIHREPDLSMQAVLTGQDVAVWEKVFADFTRQYGSVLTVHAQVQQERDAVVAKIETIVGGAFPYVLTTDGRRLSPGGVLEGRTIAAIRDGELVFTDGARLRYGY